MINGGIGFFIKDMVIMKILMGQHKSTCSVRKALLWKYEGLFSVVKLKMLIIS